MAATRLSIALTSSAATGSVSAAAYARAAAAVCVRRSPVLRVSSEISRLTLTASGTASGRGTAVLATAGSGGESGGRRSLMLSNSATISITTRVSATAALCPTLVCITGEITQLSRN